MKGRNVRSALKRCFKEPMSGRDTLLNAAEGPLLRRRGRQVMAHDMIGRQPRRIAGAPEDRFVDQRARRQPAWPAAVGATALGRGGIVVVILGDVLAQA